MRSFVTALLLVAATTNGCVPVRSPRSADVGGRDVSLRYEGSCADLACCSAHAIAVEAETTGAFACGAEAATSCQRNSGWFAPGFTCDPRVPNRYRQPDDPPYLSCSDRERWLSVPGLTRAECGETYLVCHRGTRVTAVARDRSAPNGSGNVHFEGSLGLLRAIGGDPAQRDTIVSIYALHERDRIASDPQCTGD